MFTLPRFTGCRQLELKPVFYSVAPQTPNNTLHNAGDIPANPSLGFAVRNEIDPVTNQLAKFGQSWDDVKSGNGVGGSPIYAHVESVQENPDLVNIEYIILFPFNHGINNDICQFGADVSHHFTDHIGDLTFLNLVYCKSCDQIIRASFSAHGDVLQAFDLMSNNGTSPPLPPYTPSDSPDERWWEWGAPLVQNVLRAEDDPSWTDPIRAKKVFTNFWYSIIGPYIDISVGPIQIVSRYFFQPDSSGNYVYFVQDPISNRFEHIVAFLEWGSHELYPNATGDSFCMPKHTGDGTSFLPDKVTYLGTWSELMSNSYYAENVPFIFFNGKWGSDPQPPIMHKTWYYPDNRDSFQKYACADDDPSTHVNANDNNPFGIPADRFDDVSPYHLGGWDGSCYGNPWVGWPPVRPGYTAACNLALKAYDPPVITITQPAAASYPHSERLPLNYGVNDRSGSGVASVTPALDGMIAVAGHGLASGQILNLLNELALGTHTLSIEATDHVGNSAVSSVTFSVIATPQSLIEDMNHFSDKG